MKKIFYIAESWLRIEHILYGFWAVFWGLNGLDKFFIPQRLADGSLNGWFGTAHREEQMINYFSRLNLSETLALSCCYSIAVFDLLFFIFCI